MNRTRIAPTLWFLVLGALWATLAHGADIQRGITFTDGQRITASQLHQLIDNATIQNGFIVNKPGATSLESGAVFLIYSPASQELEKITAAAALYNNTDLITSQGEKGAPAANDFLLLYDATGTVLAKTRVGNLWSNNIASLPVVVATNTDLQASIPVLASGTNAAMTLSNLFLLFPYSAIFTNLPVRTSPTNFDNLLFAASDDGTNYFMRRISLAGFFTNQVPTTALTSNDLVVVYNTSTNGPGGTNPIVASTTLGTLAKFFNTSSTIVISNLPCTNNVIIQTNLVNARPPFVRAVLVVTNLTVQTGTYALGDEIPMSQIAANLGNPAFTFGSSGTNVWVSGAYAGGTFQLDPKAGGSVGSSAVSQTNFSCKLYITEGL